MTTKTAAEGGDAAHFTFRAEGQHMGYPRGILKTYIYRRRVGYCADKLMCELLLHNRIWCAALLLVGLTGRLV